MALQQPWRRYVMAIAVALCVAALAGAYGASRAAASPAPPSVNVGSGVAATTGDNVLVPVSLSGFDTATDLVAIVSVPEDGGSLSVDTSGLDLTLEYGYSSFSGERAIGFRGSLADVDAALASRLSWTASSPGTISLSVSVAETAPGAFFNPANGHYYTVGTGVQESLSWTNAAAEASAQTLFGMQGYLVTITTPSENDFTANYTDASYIWIGANDAAVEGQWRWATGPEAGTQFWQGAGMGTPMPGMYTSWQIGEPNDAGGEDYAVTNYGGQGLWNDLPESYPTVVNYLIEFGGMPEDIGTALQASATGDLQSLAPTVSLPQNLAGVAGEPRAVPLLVNGFDSASELVATMSLAPGGGALSVDTGELGLTLAYGYSTFTGAESIGFRGPAADVITALQSRISWTPPATGRTAGVSVAVGEYFPDTFFNPDNGHYYRVGGTGTIRWDFARDEAASQSLHGMQGYLATITTPSENAFVADYTDAANVWLGASDAASEGQWKWETGPEAGTPFWQGVADGTPVDGSFAAWAEGEPNDWGENEDYAVTNWGGVGSWNDFALDEEMVSRYLVEFGGMAGDSSTALQARDAATLSYVVPPGAPTNLTATRGDGSVTLAFDTPSDDGGSPITGYEVSVDDGEWISLAGDGKVDGLTNGTEYGFVVRAVNDAGAGSASEPVEATPATTPEAPSNVTATRGDSSVTLTFDAPSDDGGSPITGYEVSVDEGEWTPLPEGGTIGELTNGTTYTFAVRAVNDVGFGPSAGDVATPATTPGAPTNLTATRGDGSVTLAFDAPADDGGSPITGYEVSVDEGDWIALPDDGKVSGLTNGTTYLFWVRAVNEVGGGATLSPVEATPVAAQTITFDAIPDVTVSAGSITVRASADSGLPVTLTTATPSVCTVDGRAVALVATGTCTLVAHQAGDASHAPAPEVNRTFAVTKAVPAPSADPVATGTGEDGSRWMRVELMSGAKIVLLDASGAPATVVTVPEGTYTLDGQTGTITFVPKAGFSGDPTPVHFRISDSYNRTASGTFAPRVPAPAAAPSADPPVTSPQDAGARVTTKAGRLIVASGRGFVPVRCSVKFGSIASCEIVLLTQVSGRDVTVGRARVLTSDRGERRNVATRVQLNALGRALAGRPGGTRMRVAATLRLRGTGETVEAIALKRIVLARFAIARSVLFMKGDSGIRARDRRFLSSLRRRLSGATTVRCDGYTDSDGRRALNGRLAQRRAAAVCAYLARGTGAKVRSVGHGEADPRATNATAAGRALNRRTEISVGYGA